MATPDQPLTMLRRQHPPRQPRAAAAEPRARLLPLAVIGNARALQLVGSRLKFLGQCPQSV
jgi:hypothetical protein